MTLTSRRRRLSRGLTTTYVIGQLSLSPVNIETFHVFISAAFIVTQYRKQESQLMLTNQRDAFRGQSRSPNLAPVDMLGTVS